MGLRESTRIGRPIRAQEYENRSTDVPRVHRVQVASNGRQENNRGLVYCQPGLPVFESIMPKDGTAAVHQSVYEEAYDPVPGVDIRNVAGD
ncbi:hypothetical protein AURDEDRAFT_114210 [Auricularia subglabra TFB-10046 SS5]|nr:hypothetical protein AURDEDRAFT_114210 [Auricularia subglabra TFB-10046 SS5]